MLDHHHIGLKTTRQVSWTVHVHPKSKALDTYVV